MAPTVLVAVRINYMAHRVVRRQKELKEVVPPASIHSQQTGSVSPEPGARHFTSQPSTPCTSIARFLYRCSHSLKLCLQRSSSA